MSPPALPRNLHLSALLSVVAALTLTLVCVSRAYAALTRPNIAVFNLAAPAGGATVTVRVVHLDYSPDPTIQVGDTVQWVWDVSNHSTTSVAGQTESWNSGLKSAGATFTHTFTHTGTFNYYCTLHGGDNGDGTARGMSGTVTVVGSGSAPVPVTIPVADQNVLYTFSSNTDGERATAFLNVTYHPAAPATVSWTGIHAADGAGPGGTPGVTSGFQTVPAVGEDILQLDPGGGTWLELGAAANQLRIENKESVAKAFRVKATW